VQRPRIKLGGWLQHSTQSVETRELRMVMERLKQHEPDTYSSVAAGLQAGTMPTLLFCPDLCTVNPALLYMMHALQCASPSSRSRLPSTPCTAAQLSGQNRDDSAEQMCDAGEDSDAAVGEVWWLFDSATPYLAEVFPHGAVPGRRLPHMDKSSIRGRHVARVLGRRSKFVKLVAHSARMCLFTAWCASLSQINDCSVIARSAERGLCAAQSH
jgi:hypothetical protein